MQDVEIALSARRQPLARAVSEEVVSNNVSTGGPGAPGGKSAGMDSVMQADEPQVCSHLLYDISAGRFIPDHCVMQRHRLCSHLWRPMLRRSDHCRRS